MIAAVEAQLKARYPASAVDELMRSYTALKQSYYLGRFKPGELEGGFVVEAVRRIVEFALFDKEIPVGVSLPAFNDNELKRYENAQGDDAFRFHIPRILKSIYGLRNKRGVGHLSTVSPNIIDCTYIMAACDWVMAELLRQSSTLPVEECQRIVDSIVQRKHPIVFEDGSTQRVMNTKLTTTEQVLVLLYHNCQPVSDKNLLEWTEYASKSMFKTNILAPLHKARFIELRKDGLCVITSQGISRAEELIRP